MADALGRLRVVRVKARYLSWALALRRLLSPAPRRSSSRTTPGTDPSSSPAGSEDQPDSSLALVVCDGLADLYWPERWAEEERGVKKRDGAKAGGWTGSTAARLGVRGAEDVGMREVMHGIGRLRKETGAVVVVSLQGLWVSGSDYKHEGFARDGCSLYLFHGDSSVYRTEPFLTETRTPFLLRHKPPPSLSLPLPVPNYQNLFSLKPSTSANPITPPPRPSSPHTSHPHSPPPSPHATATATPTSSPPQQARPARRKTRRSGL